MERRRDLLEILVRAEAAVDLEEVARVVAVSVRLEQRREIYRVRAERLYMLYPVLDLRYAMYSLPVVFKRRAAEAERVDLVKYTVICPHSFSSDKRYCPGSRRKIRLLYHKSMAKSTEYA